MAALIVCRWRRRPAVRPERRKALRGEFEESLARGRAGLREIRVIEIRRVRLAAGSVGLIGCQRGVAVDQLHAIERHRQFLGHQLLLRGRDPLAQFFFAAIGGDAAVGSDGDPGIDLIHGRRTGERRLAELGLSGFASGHAESYDQDPRALEEVAAVERGARVRSHGCGSHFATSFA